MTQMYRATSQPRKARACLRGAPPGYRVGGSQVCRCFCSESAGAEAGQHPNSPWRADGSKPRSPRPSPFPFVFPGCPPLGRHRSHPGWAALVLARAVPNLSGLVQQPPALGPSTAHCRSSPSGKPRTGSAHLPGHLDTGIRARARGLPVLRGVRRSPGSWCADPEPGAGARARLCGSAT